MYQANAHDSQFQHQGLSAQQQACIDRCEQCSRSCSFALEHSRKRGGALGTDGHLQMLQDCAQVCQVSADFLRRASPVLGQTCETCAIVCEHCAHDCQRLIAAIGGDAVLESCAEACRMCAASCRAVFSSDSDGWAVAVNF